MISLAELSRSLQQSDPAAALSLYPLNVEARILVVTETLNQPRDKIDLVTVDRELRRGLKYDRADARLYSLMGEVRRLMGDQDGANHFYDKALAVSKTEVNALQRSILREIEKGRMDAALKDVDLLLRRWPAKFAQLAPLLPEILADSDGYQAAVMLLGQGVPWRGRLLNFLGRDPQGADIANSLILDLKRAPVPPAVGEIWSMMNSYIAQKRYDAAYRLFVFSTPDDQRNLLGYVFNGDFLPLASAGPFDWQLHRVPGVEVSFIERTGLRGVDGGARLQFLGQPVKGQVMRQLLHLPPGKYQINLRASGRGLRLPKKLFWSLQCVSGVDRDRVRLEIPEGSFDDRMQTANFTIGADCPAQILSLNSGLAINSWSLRYQGQLTMHSMRIEAVEL